MSVRLKRHAAWCVLLAALIFTASAFSKEAAETSVDMSLKQVSPHVWYVQGVAGTATENEGFISNAGVVITPEGVVVIDALGTPALARKLLGLIREKTDKPIKHVLVTHYHADHIYGLQVFKAQGAVITAPKGAGEYLGQDSAEERLNERRVSLFPWVDDDTRLVVPDEIVDTTQSIQLGGIDFLINYQGAAHSHGDLTVLVKQDKVLFSGDLIFEGRTPFVGDADTKQWLETLGSLVKSEPEALVPGHGPAASDPASSLKITHDYIAFLRAELGQAVEEFTPFAEAYDSIDWSEWEQQPAFQEANRRNAYQVYLSLEQESLN